MENTHRFEDQTDPEFFDSEESQDQFPEEEKQPVNPLAERYQFLSKLVTLVENPVWKMSLEEVEEILLDLGCLLRNSTLSLQLNDVVGEDPLNRGDALGNVLMFHSKQSRLESPILEEVGNQLLDLCHSMRLRGESENRAAELIADLYSLDPSDDSRSEDILASKKLIMELRRENQKLDRRNEKLWIMLQDYRKKYPDSEHKIRKEKNLCKEVKYPQLGPKPLQSTPNVINEKPLPDTNCTLIGERGMPKTQSRKLDKAQISKSQLDFLEW